MEELRFHWQATFALLFVCTFAVTFTSAETVKRAFTVRDDIGFTLFSNEDDAIKFSPDGRYFAVYSERGRLDLNAVEDSLRFYRSSDIDNFLAQADQSSVPAPMWVVTRSAKRAGRSGEGIIGKWRWLKDSTSVAFLDDDRQRLMLADIKKRKIEPLTAEAEVVKNFDISDRQHYVYVAADRADPRKIEEEREAQRRAPAVVGTGRRLDDLILDDPITRMIRESKAHDYVWAFIEGQRFKVMNGNMPLQAQGLAISPDGQKLVTILPVPNVPVSWESLYLPPLADYTRKQPAGIHVGHGTADQYVEADLRSGAIRPLIDAPLGYSAGWSSADGYAKWSDDGKVLLLLNTFLPANYNASSRPCVAVLDVASNISTCVEIMKSRTKTGVEEGYHFINDSWFQDGRRDRVIVRFDVNESYGANEYQMATDGTWQKAKEIEGEVGADSRGLEVRVKQFWNEPPVLVAHQGQTSRVIWDPNPQMKEIERGEESIYSWKDPAGKPWRGGLFKPLHYEPAKRYPMVIQTHGFSDTYFLPAGVFTTAFAARELAAAGIVVLQIGFEGRNCSMAAEDEVPCVTGAYESAARQLISDGLVDPEKVGIIGFSRTCLYVMKALASESFPLAAASVTDGVMADYWQYVDVGLGETEIGEKPFGPGLQKWIERSPGFNLDKAKAPLLVVGEGPDSLLGMWQPYSLLHALKKPVDLIMLNTDAHVLTNPALRMASQGGSVDWFRFWLQGYENPDPTKAEQYKRWRELKKLQAENEKNSVVHSGATN